MAITNFRLNRVTRHPFQATKPLTSQHQFEGHLSSWLFEAFSKTYVKIDRLQTSLCIFLVLSFVAPAATWGEQKMQPSVSNENGSVAFQILDSATGYAVAGATVSWAQLGSSIPASLPNHGDANQDGAVHLELPPGGYAFEITAPAYRTMRTYFPNLTAGETEPLNVNLDPDTPPPELRKDVVEPELRSGYELVHGYVVDATTHRPLSGVKVRLPQGGDTARTDDRGYFQLYAVASPEVKRPEDTPSFDSLIASYPGYKTYVDDGLLHVSKGESLFRIALTRGKGTVHENSAPGAFLPPGAQREPPVKGPPIKKELRDWLANPGQALMVGGTAAGTSAGPLLRGSILLTLSGSS